MSGLRQWPLSGHRRAAGFLAVTDVCGTPREARGLDVCLGEKERGGREKRKGRREGEEAIMLFVPTGNFHWCMRCILDLDICGE